MMNKQSYTSHITDSTFCHSRERGNPDWIPAFSGMTKLSKILSFVSCFLFLVSFIGCDNMRDGNRYKPYEVSDFFKDGNSSRPTVEGTVPQGFLREDEAFYTGKLNDTLIKKIPMDVTDELVKRGHERFNIYCIVCHGPTGNGDGLAVAKGMAQPTSFHQARLKNIEDGHLFDVITNGRGQMKSYAKAVKPKDRWAIVAYIRYLQALTPTIPDPEPTAQPETTVETVVEETQNIQN